MQTKNQISLTRKTLYATILLAIFVSAFGAGNLPYVRAQEMTSQTPMATNKLPACHTLELVVTAGEGTLEATTPQNCDSGYLAGSMVEVVASPTDGFGIIKWEGTDNDSDMLSTKQIEINGNAVVKVYFEAQMQALALVTISGKVTSRRWPYEGVAGVTVSVDTGQITTTASDGTYSIANVSTGTRTITATKSDWWATGTSVSEVKTVNVSANTTVNFTQFAVKATANATISTSKSSVTPGETFNVTVSLRNSNYAVGNVTAYLDLSFSDTKFTVGTPSGSGWANITKFPVGSTLWGVQSNGTSYQMTSTSYLVSAERLNSSYGSNTTYSFTVPITVKSTATSGTVTLYYRGTIGDERDPDSTGSGTRDQQGWNAITYNITVVPLQPDLTLTSVGANPTSIYPGNNTNVTFTVKNQGNAATSILANEIRLSTNTTINSSDTLLANSNMSSIAAGASTTNTPTVTISSSTAPGTYYIGVITDAGNIYDESDENNNTGYAQITVLDSRPDLTVTSVSANPSSISPGNTTSVSFTVKNQGNSATSILANELRLSTDTTINSSDSLLGNSNMSSIAAGASITNTPTVTIPSGTSPGTYYIGVITDAGNIYSESNENNNTGYTQIIVLGNYSISGTVKSRQWPYWGVSGVSVTSDSGQSSTTDSNGNYTLTNVLGGSRTITASRNDWFATGTASNASQTFNLTGNTSNVNFNQFTTVAAPEATISVSKTNVVPGETFTVTVSLKNMNTALSSGRAYLDLSFSGDKVTLGTITNNGFWTGGTGLITYTPGSTNVYGVTSAGAAYNLTSSQVVDYLIGTERVGIIHFNNAYTFTVPLTVKAGAMPGAITLKFRGTIEDKRDPVSSGSGTLDQQGWNVNSTTVNVTALPLDIVGFEIAPTNPAVGIGDSFTVRYQINNPNTVNQSTYLLARSRTSAGVYASLKDSTGNIHSARTITPGTAWYDWQVKVYDGAPAGSGYSLTGFISTTTNWSDYTDSANLNNAFTVVAPQPELTAYLSNTGTFHHIWRTVNFRLGSTQAAKNYEIWAVIDSGQTIPTTTPLSQYTGKIYSLYVIDTTTNSEVSQELATMIVLDADNRLLLANDPITPSIPLAYLATGISTMSDSSGASYQYAKSRVTSTIPESMMYYGAKGLNNPTSRKEIYKIILLELILNQEMSNTDLFENLSWHLGINSALYEKLAASIEIAEMTKSNSDPYFKSIEEVEASINSGILKQNITKASEVLDAISEGTKISGEVYEAILMKSLADAQAEKRLLALHQVIDSHSLPGQDYLLVEALAEAETEFYLIKNSYHQAYLSAATNGSTLQNIDNFYSTTRTFIYPLIKKGLTKTVEQFLSSHPSLNVFLKKGKPYMFALSVMWDNFVTIDGKLHLLRQADLCIVLAYQMEVYLRDQRAVPSTFNHEQTNNLLMLNDMRQYLGYFHFHRLGQVLDGKLEDIILLDVVGGLLGFYEAFYPDYTTAREDYEAQENLALRNYANLAPPYFLLNSNDKFSPLILALNTDVTTDEVIAPLEFSKVVGEKGKVTLIFKLKNTGQAAGIYYISVSMDNGLNVTQPLTTNTIWTRYDIGSLIHYKDGTPNPRQSTKLLYENTGTLAAGGEVEFSLTVQKSTPGFFNLYYRTAMRALNAPDMNENYMRDPATGSVTDQQGWPAKTIKFTQPEPSVTSSLSSFQLELGGLQAITFTLQNNGGNAAPAYIDVSVSDGLDIVESYPVFAWDCYPPGSNVYHAGEDNPRPSEYLLCSSVQSQMAGQETRTFTIVVKAKSLGNQWIKYRAAMNPADSRTTTIPDSFVRAPATGSVDQQGWPAYNIPLTIWENHPPTIVSFSPNQTTINSLVGQPVNFSVDAQDQDPQSTLSYGWLWDNFTVLGVGQSFQWTASQSDIGNHTIDVVVRDGEMFVSRRWAVIVQSTNINPTLTWTGEPNYTDDGLHPESGDTSTNYEYRIKYADADNHAPSYVKVHIKQGGADISGSPFTMTCTGATHTTGVICSYTKVGLPTGTNLTYQFVAQDSQGSNATPTVEKDAPDVSSSLPTVYLSLIGYTVNENGGNAVVRIMLSQPATGTERVYFDQTPGSATSADYTPSFGYANFFTVGQTYIDAQIPIINDALQEGNESFTVFLSSPNNCVLGFPQSAAVTIVDNDVTTFPEIDLRFNNNGTSIADGDIIPSTADGTDFGNSDITSGTVSHVFRVWNTGTASLNLTGNPRVVISGTNASDFTLGNQPSSPIGGGNNSVQFEVIFNPSGTGLRKATISIANDDSNENPYNFDIQGTGTGTSGPTVVSILRTSPNPTSATSVNFIVTFSESVTNVDANDFSLITSGVTGTSITGISGSGTTHTISVNTGSGYGTIRLDVPGTATITDMASNPLIGLPFTTGQVYTKAIQIFLPMIVR